ncbi:putative translation initiation factor IF-2 [Trypanosoma grayi]|uniref:putative translation initiation factor IF-2 n=1 Tax=Trypanosoma grayi TaxID=71804 RepID=UPI0004F43A32|nr:putative translation initiation factor IF-2 [Trypanosoma grayi]KEG10049.1 putative translation initiation factor IF-2 [Trypanosoma grayi]
MPVTFVDTPGQRVFSETRLHAQIVADCLLLVVSVVEGVQSQTYETIKVALNVDRPLIVVLNKMDLFSDSQKAWEAVSRVLAGLREAGLNVDMIHKERDIDQLRLSESTPITDAQVSKTTENSFQVFAPMKKVDPTYKGSRKHPVVSLQRRCVGVCISAKKRKNFDLLWSLIDLMTLTCPPLCHSKSMDYASHSCSLQAVVLEASKHLFNEEVFRVNKSLQGLQKREDTASEKRQARFEQNSISVRINSSLNAARRKVKSSNPTSTNCLVLTVIVKEGCITKGVPFVADQTKGRVDYMVNALGDSLERADPGTAVTIIDVHSTTGCPGVGTHLLSMPTEAEGVCVFEYRRLLQWFVECFPDRLHLLRPRGMNVSFSHLGDYGQLKNTLCLEYQLLYGPPEAAVLVEPDSQSTQQEISPDGTPKLLEKSIAEYLREKNAEETDVQDKLMLERGCHETMPMMDEDLKAVLQTTWAELQPQNRPKSQEEYDDLIRNCIQVGVLFKVDSWHSARMLHREVTRLGTRKVAFHAIGMRFGELVVDDILFFSRAMKIVVCYRTPLAASTELDRYLEINDTWVLQTDDISDVVLFLKWCAVSLHKEHAPDDCGKAEPNKKSYFVLMNNRFKRNSNEKSENQETQRRRQLLITPRSSHENL